MLTPHQGSTGGRMSALAHAVAHAARECGQDVGAAAILSALTDGRGESHAAGDSLYDEFRHSLGRFSLALEQIDTGAESGAGDISPGDEKSTIVALDPNAKIPAACLARRTHSGWQLHTYDAEGGCVVVEAAQLPWGEKWHRVAMRAAAPGKAAPAVPSWLKDALSRQKSQYVRVAIAAVCINLFGLAMPLFSMAVYDRIAPNAAYVTLWTLSIGVLAVLAFDFIVRLLRTQLAEVAARRIDVLVSREIHEHLLGLMLGRMYMAAGALADRLRGFQSVQEFLAAASLLVLVDLPFVILFTAMIFMIGGHLGWVVLVVASTMLLVSWLLQMPMAKLARQAIVHGHGRHGNLVETITALEAIRAVGAERMMRGRMRELVTASAIANTQTRLLSNLTVTSASTLTQFGTLILTVAGVYMIGEGSLTIGGLIATLMLAGRIFTPIAQLSQIIVKAWQARIASDELAGFAALPQLRPPGQVALTRGKLGGGIAVEGASYRYPAAPGAPVGAAAPHPALAGINLTIRPGERIAILGRNGSGKSTLLKLIAGIYAPDTGATRIGDIDLRQLDPTDIRSAVGYVAQEPVLFSGTIAENIAMGWPEAGNDDILRAATLSGAEEFVRQMPDGYRYRLGERGVGLSVGQRQSVGIAQALIRDPATLLLDEPTSAMDQGTEVRFIGRLAALLDDTERLRTLVVVTHKPHLLSLVKRVVIVEAGRIVADGPRDDILHRLNKGIQVEKTT